MQLLKIFVVDSEGKPLLPTNQARARRLLKNGKAEMFSVVPFTIKLKRSIANPVGEFKIGIDDGAKMVGISVKGNDKIVFAANVELRQDVSRNIRERYIYRKARRSINLRYRMARFLNRGQKGWIPPSIKYKKEVIIRVLLDLKKRLNIISAIIEQGQFDTSSMSRGYELSGKEYQISEYEGNNWRQKVLWRDGYACIRCKSEEHLQAHHIIQIKDGGSNIVNNGATLCRECHGSLHNKEWSIIKKVSLYKYPTHLQQGKWWIYNKLNTILNSVTICFGWMTYRNRIRLCLEKDHHYDASAMLNCNNYETLVYNIKPRRTKVWNGNPTKTCLEKLGFRHYDVIKSYHKTRGVVIGSIRSLKKNVITIRTFFDNQFPVSYKKSHIIYRPSGLIYTL